MSIQFEQITKRYQGVPVVSDVTLEVASGEFFVLLGPSGSGKSTILRAVAGLTGIDRGRISLHGRDVTHLPPRERGVGFVFQHYALFRHMTVAENVEFALRIRRMKAPARRERRRELLRLVALEGFDERLPGQLSGGQQQRVAVARALAHEPSVLLLDEPFGALDAKIRVELRRVVKDVQRNLGTTTILVTHDQEEAFALADRIGIMNVGRLLEVGRPEQLYRRPAARFVATFLGAANLLLGELTPGGVRVGAAVVRKTLTTPGGAASGSDVVTVIRPEDLELATERDALTTPLLGQGVVRDKTFAGGHERILVQVPRSSSIRPATADTEASDESTVLLEATRTAAQSAEQPVEAGQAVALGIRRIHALPTPIASFLVLARSESAIERLRALPLLTQLVRSMNARVLAGSIEDTSAPPAKLATAVRQPGVIVVEAGGNAIADLTRLASLGATRMLCVPAGAQIPRRVLVHCPSEEARAVTFGVVASLLRHLPAEATLLSIHGRAASRAERATAFRRLLDARAELRASHGLDVRTEVHIGELSTLTQQLATGDEPVLVIMGVEGTPDQLQAELAEQARLLTTESSRCPLMIAYAPARGRNLRAASSASNAL
jgi:ABC-type Fe3+/spermidine/putrescine transport system ATPase subunit